MEFLQPIHRYVALSIYIFIIIYGNKKERFFMSASNSRDKTTLEIRWSGSTNGNRNNKRTYDHLQFARTFCLRTILHTLWTNVSFVLFFFYVSFVVMGRSSQTQNVSFILMIELSSHIL